MLMVTRKLLHYFIDHEVMVVTSYPLGYIMSERGIEAISNMGPIRNVKGIQRLTGCLAALSRFISRLGKRGMPLYKLLKKTDAFAWIKEAQ